MLQVSFAVNKIFQISPNEALIESVTFDSWPFMSNRWTSFRANSYKFHDSVQFIHKPPGETIKHQLKEFFHGRAKVLTVCLRAIAHYKRQNSN